MRVSTTLVGIDGVFEETRQFENAPVPFAFTAAYLHAVPAGCAA